MRMCKLWRGIVYTAIGIVLLVVYAYYGWRIYAVGKLERASRGITKSVPEHMMWNAPESLENLQRIDLGFASFYLPQREWYIIRALPATYNPSTSFLVSIYGEGFWVQLLNARVPKEVYVPTLGKTLSGGAEDSIWLYSLPPISLRELFFLPHDQFVSRVACLSEKDRAFGEGDQYIFEGPHSRGYGRVEKESWGRGALDVCGNQNPLSVFLMFRVLKESGLAPESLPTLIGGTFVVAPEANIEEAQVAQATFVERVRKGEGDDARFIVMNERTMPTFPLADALKAGRKALPPELAGLPCVSARSVLCREDDGWFLEYGSTVEGRQAVLVSSEVTKLIKIVYSTTEGVPICPMEQIESLLQQQPDRFKTRVEWRNNEWRALGYYTADGGFSSIKEVLVPTPSSPSP